MRSWLWYAGVGLAVTLLAAAVAVTLVAPAARAGVWFAAGLSYALQLVAFGAMQALRSNAQLFLIGWGAGMLLRFGAVGAVAFWLSRSPVLPRDVTLISLVSFVVLLLFLEPLFLKQGRAQDKG
ncbi:MAG TPA: hypothetical protein VK939_04075 [Longimicrobiales bacterium]|nr:hypothetical protein [Longimicrobiales bacterium]